MRLEAAGWLYLRLSGVLLLFLVLGHMFLMHILVGVNHIDFTFVRARWAGAGWRAYDLVMLLLAMPHAAWGLRSVSFDHVPAAPRRALLTSGWLACLVVTILGAWVILTFPQPI